MRVVDSVGWIAYFTGHPLAEQYRRYIYAQSEIVCPTIIIYEVGRKLETQVSRDAAALATSQLLKTRVVPLDAFLAAAAARTSVERKLPMADAIIYATAMIEGATLVTSDAHFEGLPGVEFISIGTA